ncbi:MAG: hypothetical protein WC521_05045 [Bdellovibrionales bacterium]|jgi:hypothetical protein
MATYYGNRESHRNTYFPLFDTSYSDDDTSRAINDLIRPKLEKYLEMQNIHLFCAFRDFDALVSFDVDDDGNHVIHSKVTLEEDYLPQNERIDKSDMIADMISDKIFDIFRSSGNTANIKVFKALRSIPRLDKFTMPQEQFRKLAAKLRCEKEFDVIMAENNQRRAEAQEYVHAAERVLGESLLENSNKILKIDERYGSTLVVYLSKPLGSDAAKMIGDALLSDRSFFIRTEDVATFYENVVRERNALKPPPREELKIVNNSGRPGIQNV